MIWRKIHLSIRTSYFPERNPYYIWAKLKQLFGLMVTPIFVDIQRNFNSV